MVVLCRHTDVFPSRNAFRKETQEQHADIYPDGRSTTHGMGNEMDLSLQWLRRRVPGTPFLSGGTRQDLWLPESGER
jgi:hypothetical protein